MKPRDLGLLNSVSAPTLHPSGTHAVVSVTHPDLAADAYVGQLWTVPVAGHAGPRRLTRGLRDTSPQFSPDGLLLAFLRAGARGPAQLFVMDAAGGEPVQVTDRPLGLLSFAWAPDGADLAFISRVPEKGRYGSVDGLDPTAEPARHITTLKYQSNGVGYTLDRHTHIFIVSVPDVWAEPVVQPAPTPDGPATPIPFVAEPTQLTTGEWDHQGLAFAPDGRGLAFISARHAGRDSDLRTDVFTLDLAQARRQPRNRTGEFGTWSASEIGFGLNGTLFFVGAELGPTGRDFVARNAALFRLAGGHQPPVRLTDPETVDLSESGIVAYADDSVVVLDRTRGAMQLLAVDTGGVVDRLTGLDRAVVGAAAAGGTLVVSYADASTAGEVAVVEPSRLRTLTDFSARLRSKGIKPNRELVVAARDGHEVHGWVVLPKGDGPHPVLLNVHGGPYAQFGVGLFDEAQVYADAGYAVVMCNPRGSAGYGQEHGRAIRQALGTLDFTDVIDFFEGAVAEHPSIDASRAGVMGGSYGGFLTAWITSHDERFTAAIVERGFLDPESFIGTSDIGSFFSDEYVGTTTEQRREQSPQAHVHEVVTPTLVLHSAQDLRCPLGQAERYYTALKRAGVTTELVIFPGEDHELSRTGRPRHRRERFEVILDWWAKHLPSTSNH